MALTTLETKNSNDKFRWIYYKKFNGELKYINLNTIEIIKTEKKSNLMVLVLFCKDGNIKDFIEIASNELDGFNASLQTIIKEGGLINIT